MKGLVYSPKERIPLFKILDDDENGERVVEYYNYRTGNSEEIRAGDLVFFLMEQGMPYANDNKMIHSPVRKIPLGMILRDERGIVYINVTYKKKKPERIRISTYVSLVLE